MKRRLPRIQLTERQQLFLALLLVMLLAISMLYCVGIASMVAHQTWETAPLLWNGTELPLEPFEVGPTVPIEVSPASTGSAP